MKKILLAAAILIYMAAEAQVMKVDLQASGLTCSMCSKSINKALKTLDFIDKIVTDIKRYNFQLTFKPGSHVDFDLIKRKVEGAGFFVSGFVATILFDNVPIKANEPVLIDNHKLFFVNQSGQSLSGATQVRILDKGFVSSKEYKANSFSTTLTDQGIYHVTL